MTVSSDIGSSRYLCLLGVREYASARLIRLPASFSDSKSSVSDDDSIELSAGSRDRAEARYDSPGAILSGARALPGGAAAVRRVAGVFETPAATEPAMRTPWASDAVRGGDGFSLRADDVHSSLRKYRSVSCPMDSAPLVDRFI